jgi:SRSO17 transposase
LDEDTVFANKPELAAPMTGRFPDAGHRVGWVAADEVYGGNPKLRSALEERHVGYVLTVAGSHEVTTDAGKFRADALAATRHAVPTPDAARAMASIVLAA